MANTDLPRRYTDVLKNIQAHEVSYGCGGLKLFEPWELATQQIGYSIGANGVSLCIDDTGSWQPNWIVIGYDTGVGDPLILDTADANLPVYTSTHGEGRWELQPIAITIEAFADCFEQFADFARQRSNPNKPNQDPPSDKHRETYNDKIKMINGKKIEDDFWDALLEY